jgi:hypothetical protein
MNFTSNDHNRAFNFIAAVIEWGGSGWIKGNTNYKGFYITNYEDSNWEALARQLNDNHTVIYERPVLMRYVPYH